MQVDLVWHSSHTDKSYWLRTQKLWPSSQLSSPSVDSLCALTATSYFRFSFAMLFPHGMVIFCRWQLHEKDPITADTLDIPGITHRATGVQVSVQCNLLGTKLNLCFRGSHNGFVSSKAGNISLPNCTTESWGVQKICIMSNLKATGKQRSNPRVQNPVYFL